MKPETKQEEVQIKRLTWEEAKAAAKQGKAGAKGKVITRYNLNKV